MDLVDNTKTDKNTYHSYLPLYESLFNGKKNSATHILEIGIGPFKESNGGSIKLWADYFKNANIFSVDIIPISDVNEIIINNHRIHLFTEADAYNINFFKNSFLKSNMRFDIILDDGPHTLESMLSFIRLYSNVIKDDGILLIEDVQDINWIKLLTNITPHHLRKYIEVYDRRKIKDRYDDIVFVINKSKAV
jgi:hypothetical protein